MEIAIVEAMDPALPGIGGGETYSVNLLQYLLKTGIPTIFIGASSPASPSSPRAFTFIPASDNPSQGNLGYVLRLALSRSFASVPPGAIIHFQRPEYALPFVLFCRRNPKVITLHGRILHGVRLKQRPLVAWLYRMVESFCLRQSTAIIAVDEGTKEFYSGEYPWLQKKIRVIPVGIDLEGFQPLDRDKSRAEWGFKSSDRIIMYVGRLEIEKDLGFLIEVHRTVVAELPQARLVLVGDGRDRSRLEEVAKDMSPEKVLFLGAQRPERIPGLLNCADVLALCSLFEGSPTTVKEALACGVPVITAPVGDVAQIIKDGTNGQIVPKDTTEFARAIIKVLLREDPASLRRDCARGAAAYGFDQVGARTVELYRELLAQGS
jgi:glycosyltransferase involved in cell wall biosynthesis